MQNLRCRSENLICMLLGLPMVGGPFLHQTRNNMNKCIAFVDDDERFLEQSREHLTYRGYDVLGYRDSRTAFDAILRQKNVINGGPSHE